MTTPSHPAAAEGFSAGPLQGKSVPSGGSAAHAVASVGALALDAEALYRELLRGVRSMHTGTTRLAGIASGGAWLAERLQKDLGLDGAPGVLSSAMHRDDFAQRGLSASAQTSLPFDVNGADVLVLDDVLYTGRTIRAVLNELFDYGRPASVRLAVLVDRGGRELPLQ
ncbi:MAG TPA: bifunctional pyr operon transcriptional regulator/uracil phosphoribosyltransferase PyrR, partial [Acidovorax sp.]